jgi:DNA-binding response OmpR family regulator
MVEKTHYSKHLILIMEYIIYEDTKTVEYKGKKVPLPKKEFDMVVYFQNNKGRIISREDILKSVWKYDEVLITTRTVDVHIRKLRSKFPEIPIVTRKCYGYMWEDNV